MLIEIIIRETKINLLSQDLNFNSNGIISTPHPVATLSCLSGSTKKVR